MKFFTVKAAAAATASLLNYEHASVIVTKISARALRGSDDETASKKTWTYLHKGSGGHWIRGALPPSPSPKATSEEVPASDITGKPEAVGAPADEQAGASGEKTVQQEEPENSAAGTSLFSKGCEPGQLVHVNTMAGAKIPVCTKRELAETTVDDLRGQLTEADPALARFFLDLFAAGTTESLDGGDLLGPILERAHTDELFMLPIGDVQGPIPLEFQFNPMKSKKGGSAKSTEPAKGMKLVNDENGCVRVYKCGGCIGIYDSDSKIIIGAPGDEVLLNFTTDAIDDESIRHGLGELGATIDENSTISFPEDAGYTLTIEPNVVRAAGFTLDLSQGDGAAPAAGERTSTPLPYKVLHNKLFFANGEELYPDMAYLASAAKVDANKIRLKIITRPAHFQEETLVCDVQGSTFGEKNWRRFTEELDRRGMERFQENSFSKPGHYSE